MHDSFICDNLKFMGFSAFAHIMGGERLLGVHPESYSQISNINYFEYNNNFTSATLNIFYVGYLFCNASAATS